MHGKPYTRFIENLCLSPHRKVSGGRLLSGNQFFRLTARFGPMLLKNSIAGKAFPARFEEGTLWVR